MAAQRADLEGCDLHGSHLEDAYLSGADLTGADLTRANLIGAKLSGDEELKNIRESRNHAAAVHLLTLFQAMNQFAALPMRSTLPEHSNHCDQ